MHKRCTKASSWWRTEPKSNRTNRTRTHSLERRINKLCGRLPQYAPPRASGDSGRWHTVGVEISYMVTWTAFQSGLVTLTFDLLTLKVVSETRDVGYFCTNFSLPRPLCSRLRPDVRDIYIRRQTDRRTSDAHHRLMPTPRGAGA